MKNVLVIGARSYVGRNLLRHWSNASVAKSHLNVVGWSSDDCNLLDASSIRDAFSRLSKGEWHVIFLSVVNKFVKNDSAAFAQNIELIKNFIDQSRAFSIASLIYFSAADVYGIHPPNPIKEDSPVAPESWYSLAKFNGEWLFQNYLSTDFPVCIARIPGVYGHGGEERSIPYRMIQTVLKENYITVEGDGSNLRDMLHLTDLCAIIEGLIESPYTGILNLVSGKSVSILSIAKEVQKIFPSTPEIRHIEPGSRRNFDLVFDATILHKAVTARPLVTLSQGIAGYAPLIKK